MFPQPTMLPDDAGTVSVEYAICIVVAAVFAGVVLAIVSSDPVRDWVMGLLGKAFSVDL